MMRDIGIGLILTTIIMGAVPILAFFDDPVRAITGLAWYYAFLIFLPIAVGVLLLYLSWRTTNRARLNDDRTSD